MGRSGKSLSTSRYPYVALKDHPLAHKDGRVRVHRAVLYDAIGPGSHPCNWCGKAVTWGVDLVADHLDSDTWNNDPANLVPSCAGCNTGRATATRTRCKNGHEFTEENTYWRKSPTTTSGRSRQCKQCGRDRARARQGANPRRVELTVPLRGMALADVRDFVEQTKHLQSDTPVFTSYRGDA